MTATQPGAGFQRMSALDTFGFRALDGEDLELPTTRDHVVRLVVFLTVLLAVFMTPVALAVLLLA
jgi:hypothetical protein